MTNLNLFHKDGFNVSYALADIEQIIFGKVEDLEAESYKGNGFIEGDPVIQITFKDGNKSTFGDDWTIAFF